MAYKHKVFDNVNLTQRHYAHVCAVSKDIGINTEKMSSKEGIDK